MKNQLMAEMVKGLDEEAKFFHMDAATVKALLEKDLAVGVILAAEKGTEREKWIQERYGES